MGQLVWEVDGKTKENKKFNLLEVTGGFAVLDMLILVEGVPMSIKLYLYFKCV